MNPLDPWVALTEILLLLLLAFGVGYLVAYGQYRKPILAKQEQINKLTLLLNGPGQGSQETGQAEEIVPEPD